ncbi:MAG TPA: GntR family transcriptional regulator [Bacteroidales bacterium]|nr:GntR family transcriptional regulator [Bacteroidales bacterium]
MENQNIHIPYTDLSVQVYERLKEMILTGALHAGEKIGQEQMSKMLGVSRMPLHKAFQMLEDEYLVESIPRRGIFVRKPDLSEIIEAFECREGLEGIAARRVAENIRPKELEELKNLFKPFINNPGIEMLAYRKADQVLHDTIISLSGNKILQKMNTIGSVLIRTYPRGIVLPVRESLHDHLQILGALENRDAIKAEELVRNHSRKARNILEQELLRNTINQKNEI